MNDIVDVIKSLNNFCFLEPASEEQIKSAEKDLGLSFANEYKQYVRKFGVASANGIELTGVTTAKRLSVVEVTKQERGIYPELPADLYVIENVAIDGIITLQSQNGKIYSMSPNTKVKEIAESLADYILSKKNQ